MLICLNCEIEVPEGSAACPQCGGSVEEVSEEEYEYVEEGAEVEEEVGGAPDLSGAEPAYSAEEAAPYEEAPPPDETPPHDEPPPSEQAPPFPETPEAPAAESGFPAPGAADAFPPPSTTEPPPGGPLGAPALDDEEKKRDRKERAAKRRAAKLEKEGKKEARPRRDKVSAMPKPPEAPKSIRLEQRRPPVLLATLVTLFVSLYFLVDFVGSILYPPLHFLQAGLFLWGFISCLFLYGHGRWGRGGAFLLGLLSIGAGIFFMIKFKQENFIFLVAMG
ncbi:MAG: hypothetical protein ACYTHN_07640, partial [Planctomycetota bacterium]